MARVRGPLFSIEAFGKLCNALCFQRRRGAATVYGYKVPKVPNTAQQLDQQASVRGAIECWQGLPGASKVWWKMRAVGMATTGYNLFVKEYLLGMLSPAGDWVSPTSYADPSNVWVGEENAYDGNTSTYAPCMVPTEAWCGWLELYLSGGRLCNKVQLYVDRMDEDIDMMRVEVRRNREWVQVYEGVVTPVGEYREFEFGIGCVDGMRVCFYNSGNIAPWTVGVFDSDFWM